jgi:hypothetical protein
MTDDEYKLCAIASIRRYLNYKKDETLYPIDIEYTMAVKRLIAKVKEMDSVKISGVKTYSSDGQNFSFNEQDPFAITPDIAMLLPKKKRFYAWQEVIK